MFTGTPKYGYLQLAIKICSEKNVKDIPKEVENHQKVLESVKGTISEKSENFVCLIFKHYFLFTGSSLNLTFNLLKSKFLLFLLCVSQIK